MNLCILFIYLSSLKDNDNGFHRFPDKQLSTFYAILSIKRVNICKVLTSVWLQRKLYIISNALSD